jgi:thiosulfate dehydrogenase [quinone] large subunit
MMNTDRQKPAGWWALGLARIIIGVMWFQQTLWKPPIRQDNTFRYWVEQSGKYGIFDWYKDFINTVFLPNFDLFAYQTWAGETFIALTLFFGVFGRLGGLLSGLMALNLYIGLSQAPHEWFWTYLFIAIFGFLFFFTRAGRYVGLDQILAPKVEQAARDGKGWARILAWLL